MHGTARDVDDNSTGFAKGGTGADAELASGMIDNTVGGRDDMVRADDAAAAVEFAVADDGDLVRVVFDRDLGAADDGWLELGGGGERGEEGEEEIYPVAVCSLVENLAKYRFLEWVGRWAASASSSYGGFHYDPQG
jgi:hypothetical protein